MQLSVLLSLLAAFLSVLHAGSEPVEYPWLRLLAVIAILGIQAAWLHQRLIFHPDVLPLERERQHAQFERAWPLIQIAGLAALFGWAQFGTLVSVNWGLRQIPFADELAAAIPAIFPLMARWSLLDRSCHSPRQVSWEPAWAACRLFLVPALVPLTVVAGWIDATRLSDHSISPQTHLFVGLAGLVLFVVGLPHLLTLLWTAEPLPRGGSRDAIERIIHRAGLPFGRVLLWHTGGRVVNAVVTGLLPGRRDLFLTDGLVRRLDTPQLTAVAAHEVAHCLEGHHQRLLLSLSLPVGFLCCLTSGLWNEAASLPLPVMAVLLGALAASLLLHGHVARLLEHEADWRACFLLSSGQRPGPSEVEQLCEALQATDPDSQGDWLHPAPWQRQAFLQLLAENPSEERRFAHTLWRLLQTQFAVLIGLISVWFWSVA